MRIGYLSGYLAGEAAATARFERLNALLTDQLADARFAEKHQRERADRAVDLLVQHMGLPAISESSQAERLVRASANTRSAEPAVPMDPYEDLPIGHRLGSYASQDEASLRFDDEKGMQ